MRQDFFKALNQEANQLKDRRASSSDGLYRQGLELLDKAEQQGYRDPSVLPLACTKFLHALKTNRQDVRPYMALAYVFLILQDLKKALEYIRPVLEMQPKHPLARKMQGQISAAMEKKKQTPRSGITEAEEAQEDQFFEQTEAALDQVRQNLPEHLPDLATDDLSYQALEQKIKSFESQITDFDQRIEILSSGFEVMPLRQKLMALRSYQARLETCLKLSHIARELMQKMANDMHLIGQVIAETRSSKDKADIPVLEENMEILQDNLEAYNSQILDLAEQKMSVQTLQRNHQMLFQMLQNLEDEMDDLEDRLAW